MNKTNVGKNNEQIKIFLNPVLIEQGFEIETLIEELKLEMNALAVSAGSLLMSCIIKSEASQLTGGLYTRQGEMYPWGEQKGYVMLGGQKVPVERPRVRTGRGKGKEVPLTSYKKFQQENERTNRVFAEAMANVSCRDYKRAIEKFHTGYGISKSVISREIVTATAKELDELCHRSLEGFDMVVLLIDGIEIGGSVFICALGVNREGKKRLLGFLEGATENSEVCKRLLENIHERGIRFDQPMLAILDGSKALSKAVRHICGDTVFIQRCQEHKIRNVRDHLPKKYQLEIERKIRAAYKMNRYDDAFQSLKAIIRELYQINETAARSLEEGLEETLTVHRLQMPAVLRRSFSTTNIIESVYSRSRHVMRNVKRWTNNNQKARWLATALIKSENSFRRVAGYRSMQVLIVSLETKLKESILSIKAA